MYAGCYSHGCSEIAPSKLFFVDRGNDVVISCKTHCKENMDSDSVKKIQRVTLPISEDSSKPLVSGCYNCDRRADYVARFTDGLGVVTTEARCRDCVKHLKERDNFRKTSLSNAGYDVSSMV